MVIIDKPERYIQIDSFVLMLFKAKMYIPFAIVILCLSELMATELIS